MVSKRLGEYIDFKDISYYAFENSIGASRGAISKSVKDGKNIGSGVLENILILYTDLNSNWLLTGAGKMIKKDAQVNAQVNAQVIKKQANYPEPTNGPSIMAEKEIIYSNGKGVPLIPIEAMAGWGNGDTTVMEYDAELYNIPEFNELKVDFMIRVKGSSMYPNYNSGDIVACKKLPLDTFFQWNKVYVLDTIQGAMIKRLKKSTQKSHINCISDNKDYDSFDLSLTEVHSLALVVGVIRLE